MGMEEPAAMAGEVPSPEEIPEEKLGEVWLATANIAVEGAAPAAPPEGEMPGEQAEVPEEGLMPGEQEVPLPESGDEMPEE